MKWPQIEADGVDINVGEITNCDITEGQFPHMCMCNGGTLRICQLPIYHRIVSPSFQCLMTE